MPIYDRVGRLVATSAEQLLAGVLICWGAVLLAPHDTFADAKAYQTMASIAPELAWGTLLFALGAVQGIGLLLARWGLVHVHAHRAALATDVTVFVLLAIVLFDANPWAVGWGLHGLFAIAAYQSLAMTWGVR